MAIDTRIRAHAGDEPTCSVTGPFSHHPGFFGRVEAEVLFRNLQADVCWQQEWLTLYGRRLPVPRLLSWCGDHGVNYRYSGTDHPCEGWLPAVTALRRRLAEEAGFRSNLVLMNRYRDGRDHMGWHTDDERGLAGRIASVSLGAARRFLIRWPGEARARAIDLQPGALLIMDGRLRHALPRTRKPVGERINLTFRWVDAGR